MDAATLINYLLGSRAAIETVAHSPWSLIIGLVLVLTAGIARGYRKHDLWRKPGYLFLPLVASAGTSLLLYLLVLVAMALGEKSLFQEAGSWTGHWLRGYASMLGLFWMTAPLAWLYGIPIERWTDRPTAVKFRLKCLGLVSVWRMALIMRVLVVLLDCSVFAAVVMVMLFGDFVALAGLWATRKRAEEHPPQLIAIMSGVGPVAPAEVQVLDRVRGCLLVAGIWTAPVWFICLLFASGNGAFWTGPPQTNFEAFPPATDALVVACAALIVWGAVLIPAQVRQRRRTRIESLIGGGQVATALSEMSARSLGDFPAHWLPPPGGNFATKKSQQTLLEAVSLLPKLQVAPWVRSAYLEQFGMYLDEALWYWFDDDVFCRIPRILERLPEGPELAARSSQAIEQLFQQARHMAGYTSQLKLPQEKEQAAPFPISEADPNQEVWSMPDWPRDSIPRRDALAVIRALAGQDS